MASVFFFGGKWRAQVNRRGTRESAIFDTQEDAEVWAKNTEAAVLGSVSGEVMRLTNREWADLCNRAKERAKVRGISFEIAREEIKLLYEQSQGRCRVSGILFNRFRPLGSTKRPWYPSLDRIDSRKAYTFDNCRFVCVAVNIAMGEWGEWVLRGIAEAMLKGLQVKCEGPQEESYSFPALTGAPENYRQIVRRRRREKARNIPPDSRQVEKERIENNALVP